MDNLVIAKTKDTFEINCNYSAGTVDLTGTSYPEDSVAFFDPVFDWIERYFDSAGAPAGSLTVNLRINYLNTSTTKCLLDLFDILEQHHLAGTKVRINWFYKKNDRIILETGEEFKEDLELPFDLLAF